MGCGRLNIITEHVQPIFEVVAPVVRARQDMGHLTALAQLSAKFGLASHAEADKVLQAVCVCFQMPESQRKRGYTSQVVYGQLLLALVFSEEASAGCPISLPLGATRSIERTRWSGLDTFLGGRAK